MMAVCEPDTKSALTLDFAASRTWGLGDVGEGGQMVQTSNYEKIDSEGSKCTVVTIVSNTVLYT